jgi:serine protease Do
MKTGYSAKSLLSVCLLGAVGAFFTPTSATLAQPSQAVVALPDFADLVDRVGPAVVNIRTTEKARMGQGGPNGMNDPEMEEFFRRFFGVPMPRQQPQPDVPRGRRQAPQQEEEVPRGVGSGFIVSNDGYIMTNSHVVEGADEVYVTLTDKREFKAKIIGSDKRSDVALVKIEGANLPKVNIGDSNKVRAGEWVIAIGSPFGLENTVTAGIVSAKARDTGDYLPLIQTDVAVNPGNSGGPLINMRGEVIGINSQIYSRSGGYMGISFAVPIDEAMRVSDQLRTTGRVTRGRIGVQIGEVTKDVADSLGLSKAQGALVQRVEQGGPADKGGIEPGDIITRYNGTQIDRSNDLPRLVGNTKPGTKANVTVWRKGSSRELNLMIAEMESDKVAQRQNPTPKPQQAVNALGVAAGDLSEAQKKDLRVDGGAVIETAEGAAARAGLRPGDVILRINNVDIKDSKQFNAVVAKLEPRKTVLALVRRGDTSQFVTIKPNGQ